MTRKSKNINARIIPDPFDLAIIEVVEYLYMQGEKLLDILEKVPDKKDILTDIGISHLIWPQMVNHFRHVSTKAAKQQEIVNKLKQKYFVNPAFIWNYPNDKRMFVVEELFSKVAEEDPNQPMPASAKLLKKEVIKLRKQLADAEDVIAEKNKTISMLQEDIANLKLLVSQLKSKKNQDKNPDKRG